MATLTPTLTLTSTDATSDALSITVTDSLTVTNPSINIARASILHTGETELLSAAAHSTAADEIYFYVRNMDGTNFVDVKNAGGTVFAKLRAGEFMFFPSAAGEGVKVTTATAAAFVESIYFSKA